VRSEYTFDKYRHKVRDPIADVIQHSGFLQQRLSGVKTGANKRYQHVRPHPFERLIRTAAINIYSCPIRRMAPARMS
jgi:hypothetical protein